jgi:23S rRNA (cytidine1920-2'-O)/16S rRNA (cytidine1409-2'-O)-methyltransferase
VSKQRLDTLLVERGLVASRERARALILAGQVLVGGRPGGKAGEMVTDDADVSLVVPDHPYVGRGGLKLAHAIETFHVAVTSRTGLDIGASTGGFTDVLLQNGAAHVVALDVGHGQLDWKIRSDARVTVMERINARTLTPEMFRDTSTSQSSGTGMPRLFDIVTIDVSFISLRLILPVVPPLLAPDADVIALVKPQFEAGRQEVGKGGIVRDPAVHQRVLAEVSAEAAGLGLRTVNTTPSPIEGMEGNREFLIHLRVGSDLGSDVRAGSDAAASASSASAGSASAASASTI